MAKSLEGSLARLRLERVDVFHLHIGAAEKRSASGRCSTRWCHTRASTPARQYGFLGLTAIGDTGALRQVIEAGVFDGAQVVYNMLNPSAAAEMRQIIRHKIIGGCSIIPRRQVSYFDAPCQ